MQFTGTSILALFAQGKLVFSERLRWEDEWREKGAREDLRPSGGMHRKDEFFLRRWGTARAGRKKKILFAVP